MAHLKETVFEKSGDRGLLYGRDVIELSDGDSITLDLRGMARFAVAAETGATVVVSRVNNATDEAAQGAPYDLTAPAANALSTYDVDWPFYFVSTSGAAAKIGIGSR